MNPACGCPEHGRVECISCSWWHIHGDTCRLAPRETMTQPIVITYEMIVEQLRALAQERPDYIYEGVPDSPYGEDCLYVHHDGPGCIFGHALNRLGIPLDTLVGYEGKDSTGLIEALARDQVIESQLTREQLVDLNVVQQQQDEKHPWAEAVAAGVGLES